MTATTAGPTSAAALPGGSPLLIFIPVAPDDYLCFLAGTTEISWRLYTAIILLCKPFAIALYSLGLTVALPAGAGPLALKYHNLS